MVKLMVSEHLFRAYECLRGDARWFTARELAERAEIAERTARNHLHALAKSDVAECAQLFSGYRYRYAPQAEAKALIESLEEAGRVFRPGVA